MILHVEPVIESRYEENSIETAETGRTPEALSTPVFSPALVFLRNGCHSMLWHFSDKVPTSFSMYGSC